jgi:methylmalonyl-CoA mutase
LPIRPRSRAPPRPANEALYTERAAQLAAHRANRDNAACAAALAQLAHVMVAAPERVVEAAVAAADAGATLGEMAAALRRDKGAATGPTVIPLAEGRAAEPFEALRDATNSYTKMSGRPPRLFLANLGPPRQHKARADFTQAFFEVGGFQVISNNGFKTTDEAAAAALASGAPAVAICSTDETYPELVPPLVAAIKAAAPNTVVILAGRPADQVEALRAAGVDEFIYFGADALAINRWLLEQLSGLEQAYA